MEENKIEEPKVEEVKPEEEKKEEKVVYKKRGPIYWLIVVVGTAFIFIMSYNMGQKLSADKHTTKKNNATESNVNSNEESNVAEENNSNANEESNSNSNEQTSNENQTTPGATTNTVAIFDGSKAINSSEKNYTLSAQGNAGIYVTVDSTQKVLTFSYTPTKVVEFYSLNWTSTNNSIVNSTINFEKKIIDVFFGGMGQSLSGDTLFILLEDGTIEYIPIVHMFNHVQAEVISYGKINGVSDVTKFSLSNTSDGTTTLAIKSDGSFYDLWYALKDTGNY